MNAKRFLNFTDSLIGLHAFCCSLAQAVVFAILSTRSGFPAAKSFITNHSSIYVEEPFRTEAKKVKVL